MSNFRKNKVIEQIGLLQILKSDTTMNNKIIVPLIFAIGLICGLTLNSLWQDQPSSNQGIAIAEKEEDTPDPTPTNEQEPPISPDEISQLTYEQFLPSMSPFWVLMDIDHLKTQGESFSSFWEDKTLNQISQEFIHSFLPQGATSAIQLVFERGEQARFFVLPPRGPEAADFAFAVASKIKSSTEFPVDQPQLIDDFVACFPEAATSQISFGPIEANIIEAPFGEMAFTIQSDIFWFTNTKEALQAFWTTPPPPPDQVEQEDPFPPLQDRYPDTGIALFMNAAGSSPMMGPPGMLPTALSQLDVEQVAALFQCLDDLGKTIWLAKASDSPSWIEEWEPLDNYLFTSADPVGLMEVAMRWPGGVSSATQSATSEITHSTEGIIENDESEEDLPRENASTRSNRMESIPSEGAERGTPELNNLRRSRGSRAPDRMPPGRTSSNRSFGQGNAEERIIQNHWRFLSEWFPPGKQVGFNFFGFYNQTPSMTLAFPELEREDSFVQRLENLSFIQTSELEIARIPGMRFLVNAERAQPSFLPFNELIVVERDAVTYLFDAEAAAKNYMGEMNSDPEGLERRSPEVRDQLSQLDSDAQIQAVLAHDFFLYHLQREQTVLSQAMGSSAEVEAFFRAISEYIQPMALKAGFREEEWFLETCTESSLAQIVDTVLLGVAIYRFMGY